jgi:hypothetical protein
LDIFSNGHHNAAASLLDVWRVLFPGEAGTVDCFERSFAEQLERLKSYRDLTAFHANKSITYYISGTRKLLEDTHRMRSFFAEFERLNSQFLDMDARMSEKLEQALHALAARIEVDVSEIRKRMYWPEQKPLESAQN